MAFHTALSPFLVLVLLAGLLPHLSLLVSAANAFTLVPPNGDRFTPRYLTANFAWGGAIWVAGGTDFRGSTYSDVWGSYDFGRTWSRAVNSNGSIVDLPHRCVTQNSQAVIYAGAVYLVCSSDNLNHGPLGYTLTSSSLTLSSWTQLVDGCYDCYSFTVNRMAVPFDDVGTLITFDVARDNYELRQLLWQSATGNFQPTTGVDGPIPGTGTKDTWVAFRVAGVGRDYQTPWPNRFESSATVDAEGLQLIMLGGYDPDSFNGYHDYYEPSVSFNDVWQLTWQSSILAPLVSRLTDAAQFSPRWVAALYTVHDWYMVVGGQVHDPSGEHPSVADVWMSGDLGRTWTLYSAAAVPGTGAAYVNRLTLGRRLFIIGAYQDVKYLTNDVYEAVW